jgi:hypothetical protein
MPSTSNNVNLFEVKITYGDVGVAALWGKCTIVTIAVHQGHILAQETLASREPRLSRIQKESSGGAARAPFASHSILRGPCLPLILSPAPRGQREVSTYSSAVRPPSRSPLISESFRSDDERGS